MPRIASKFAWFLGVLGGDGNIQKYFLAISDQSLENLRVVEKVCKNLGIKSKITKDKTENRFKLWIFSVDFVKELNGKYLLPIGQKNRLEVPESIRKAGWKLKLAYIAGWFDAEGHVELWRQPKTGIVYKRINLCCKSKEIMSWIRKELLRLLGIKTYFRFSDKVWRIQISSKRSVEKFIKNVNFMYPTKRNKLLLSELKVET